MSKRIHIIFLALSLFLVFASLYLPKTFNDYNALNNVACGYPFPFVTFISHRALPDYAWTDNCINWLGEPGRAARLQILWLSFFVNVAIVFVLLFGAFRVIQLIRPKIIKPEEFLAYFRNKKLLK